MKKLVAITGLILIACVCIGAAAQQRTASRQISVVETSVPARGYIIKDSGGSVAVFRQDGGAPVFVTQTRTDTLPKTDAVLIKKGIAVSDERQLRRVLEDFCS